MTTHKIPYDSTFNIYVPLHVRAFHFAHNKINEAPINQKQALTNRFWDIVQDYIEAYTHDRRFKLQVNATDTQYRSSIITYMGVRVYVDRYVDGSTEWEIK